MKEFYNKNKGLAFIFTSVVLMLVTFFSNLDFSYASNRLSNRSKKKQVSLSSYLDSIFSSSISYDDRENYLETLIKRLNNYNWPKWRDVDRQENKIETWIENIFVNNPDLASYLETSARMFSGLHAYTSKGEVFDVGEYYALSFADFTKGLSNSNFPISLSKKVLIDEVFNKRLESLRATFTLNYLSENLFNSKNGPRLLAQLEARSTDLDLLKPKILYILSKLAAEASYDSQIKYLEAEDASRYFAYLGTSDRDISYMLANVYASASVSALEKGDISQSKRYLGSSIRVKEGLQIQDLLTSKLILEAEKNAERTEQKSIEPPRRKSENIFSNSFPNKDIFSGVKAKKQSFFSIGWLGYMLLFFVFLAFGAFLYRFIRRTFILPLRAKDGRSYKEVSIDIEEPQVVSHVGDTDYLDSLYQGGPLFVRDDQEQTNSDDFYEPVSKNQS